MNSQPLTACTGPTGIQTSQDPRAEKGEWIQSPTSNKKAIWNLYILGKKISFLNQVSLSISTILQAKGKGSGSTP